MELGMTSEVRTHNGMPWMCFDLPGRAYAAMRYNASRPSRAAWEVEFCNHQGQPLPHIPVRGEKRGVDRQAHADRTQALVHIREVYDALALMQNDRIHYTIHRDRASQVSHPDAGPRFVLAFDNISEREVRSILDHLRATAAPWRMLPQDVEFN